MRRIDPAKAQAARSSTIRSINKQMVLNFVRDREPISRAEISRLTELQRSTVSIIIEELVNEGLIEEIGAGDSTGGRRPTMLRLRPEGAMAIGIDVAPISTTIALCDIVGNIVECEEFTTSTNLKKMQTEINESIIAMKERYKGRPIEGVGISLPGLVDPDLGKVIYIPYFKWREWNLVEEIKSATGLDAIIDNDANAAALAELWFGRPEVSNSRDFILVLVSEGIGTGIIFDGQVYRGDYSAAGEFGHMIVGQKSLNPCSCGNFDCWEAFSSNRAAMARYAKETDIAITFPELIDRALGGEQAAIDALSETAHYLGIGITNLIVGLSPETVVVSGEITRAWSLVAEALKEPIRRSVRRGLPSSRIVPSTLHDSPTLMGSLSLVLARKFSFTPTS
jgi:predicted NBD/HSP70 family sugar kinase